MEIMRQTGKSKTCVWRWQERFMAEGIDGLLRDKTRPSRIAPLEPLVDERVVALTLEPPDREATHWTARDGQGSRHQRQLGRADLARPRPPPHRVRQFKLSNDPEFAEKLHDVVGLYVAPPAHAIVLSSTRRAKYRRLIAPSRACR